MGDIGSQCFTVPYVDLRKPCLQQCRSHRLGLGTWMGNELVFDTGHQQALFAGVPGDIVGVVALAPRNRKVQCYETETGNPVVYETGALCLPEVCYSFQARLAETRQSDTRERRERLSDSETYPSGRRRSAARGLNGNSSELGVRNSFRQAGQAESGSRRFHPDINIMRERAVDVHSF